MVVCALRMSSHAVLALNRSETANRSCLGARQTDTTLQRAQPQVQLAECPGRVAGDYLW